MSHSVGPNVDKRMPLDVQMAHCVFFSAKSGAHHVRAWYAKATQCCTVSQGMTNALDQGQVAMTWQKSFMHRRTV